MNQATKQSRLAKAKLMHNKLKKPVTNGQLIFAQMKRTLHSTKRLTETTTQWLCADIIEASIMMATKFTATVMVLGMVSNKGDVMSP